jgi:predicted transcriptional regulator of viral defense system
MNLEALVMLTSRLPCFDLPLLVQSFDDRREIVRVQLSRWMKQGKVIGLRRGMYTLADAYRRVPVSPPALAGQLYRPSYLSGLWALGYHDMIPERVVWLTCVTTRGPRRFENPFGTFDYHNVKRDCFFGFRAAVGGAADVLIAEPEKSLLDHWHHSEGEWTTDRLAEMRYQNYELVTPERLFEYARRFGSPRLGRAVERWLALATHAEEGTVAL